MTRPDAGFPPQMVDIFRETNWMRDNAWQTHYLKAKREACEASHCPNKVETPMASRRKLRRCWMKMNRHLCIIDAHQSPPHQTVTIAR